MMWFLGYWYGGYGWWWWWLAFIIIFFLLPLGYGWGYRGWGPWYRRRGRPRAGAPVTQPAADETGWGCLGTFLWFILIVAIIWIIFAWGWGGSAQNAPYGQNAAYSGQNPPYSQNAPYGQNAPPPQNAPARPGGISSQASPTP